MTKIRVRRHVRRNGPYKRRRPAGKDSYDEAMAAAWKTFVKGDVAAKEAYREAIIATEKAFDEAMEAAEKRFGR